MKNYFFALFFGFIAMLTLVAPGLAQDDPSVDTLYQVSTIQALLNGQYDGAVSFADLAQHGGFGLGTFDGLDGEMIAFDGRFYQIAYSGQVNEVSGKMTTPFAVVTHFEPDLELSFKNVKSLADLTSRIKKKLPGENLFYALRIDGYFEHLKTRSVPAQKPPYPPLATVAAKQNVFELSKTTGTMVGFYTPAFGGKINVPGFHMHYLDQDAANGGHVLDVRATTVVVQVDRTPYLFLNLPLSTAAATLEDRTHELESIEK